MPMMNDGETRAFEAEAILKLGDAWTEAIAIFTEFAECDIQEYYDVVEVRDHARLWLKKYSAPEQQEAGKE